MCRREWLALHFVFLAVHSVTCAPLPNERTNDDPATSNSNSRKAKSLFFDFPLASYRTNNEYEESPLDYDALLMSSHQQVDDIDDPEDLSRSAPSRKRYQNNGNFPNSPIYYIRLPATPYMFVPGLGYVSNPPTMNQLGAGALPPPPDPFINLPVNFMSNGKPTNIYQWPDPFVPTANRPFQQQHQPQFQIQKYQQQNGFSQFQAPSYQQNAIPQPIKKTPKPSNSDSKVTHLKGPFPFNGRPTDIIVLRDSYNALYSDALTNFYP
ncbi:uncharacterized protein LOC113378305 [Ctenocephalides felis]|nr:uncharacterized protein LOC113378305 [Ctenocephalides felis]